MRKQLRAELRAAGAHHPRVRHELKSQHSSHASQCCTGGVSTHISEHPWMNAGIESTAAVSCAAIAVSPSRWSEHLLVSIDGFSVGVVPACPDGGSAIVGSHAFGWSPSAAGCGMDR